ncbi:hypothetical protein COEREDRAFT_86991 [Coemansia reversa NRRL 1564]|uniref:Uncharacterized protein n=1 Tax=Coemansia reversa (strain ATCC 12441 / NRRL 1564) TaxID=763665 RepID=A0A2G5BC62_COERN|nr:hypothetical protein COEREDRAFT_86991 [Coemansia reversa NRRL 1564]|eukprot:PIA16609.1 hypothetical protein COEREDRAFT_86991 [Coemansia reversa NRRL 1564]
MASKTEDQILRSRLVAEDRTLKRGLRQLSTMCSRHSRLSPNETQQACQQVLQEVRWFRHTVQAAVQSQRRCIQEIRLYTEQQSALENQISEARAEVARLDDSLEESRNHKRHKIAYDEIAGEANKRPARARLEAEIGEINGDIEQLMQEEASHGAVTHSLHAQYSVVVGELKKLADMSKSALNMQDLGIYLGDGELHAEKTGFEGNPHALADMTPTTLHQPYDSHDDFGTPIEDPDASGEDQSDVCSDAIVAQDNVVDVAGIAVEEEGEEGECGEEEDEEGELLG